MGLFKSSCIVLTLSVFRPNWNRDIENTSFVVLIMGITKPCTHLHPAPSTSSQFFLAHFSHHPAPCNTLNIIRTKLSHVTGQFGQFSKFRLKNLKLLILTENWLTWYLGGADSESRLWFLKVWLENLFWGEFGRKKSELFVLPENWHRWYLEDGDSYSNISFLNFQP